MSNNIRWSAYLEIVDDLISTDSVQSMRRYYHHFDVTCYEHSVFVSYVAFRLARRFNLDYRVCARAGLLHDLYLYDPKDKEQVPGVQCLVHPSQALKNALKICSLSDKEENIIISHMWPVASRMPHSKEAVVVNVADKYCAMIEAVGIWHRMKMKRRKPVCV